MSTLRFVPDTVKNNRYTEGFYTVSKVNAKTGYVEELKAVTPSKGAHWAAEGVVKTSAGYVTLADNCAFYQIKDGTVKAITEEQLTELGSFDMVVALANHRDFALVVYVIDVAD